MGDLSEKKVHGRGPVHLILSVNQKCVTSVLEKAMKVANLSYNLLFVYVMDKAVNSVSYAKDCSSFEKNGTKAGIRQIMNTLYILQLISNHRRTSTIVALVQ